MFGNKSAITCCFSSFINTTLRSSSFKLSFSFEETELEVVNKDAFDIEFYPNPASDQITIVAPDNTSNIRVSVINASGMVVESDLFNTTDAIYNLQQLKPGVYLIRFEREGILVNKRLVIF